MNPLFLTDSYKYSHWNMYPPGMKSMYSYMESRGGEYDDIVFFGLQYILLEHLKSLNRYDIEPFVDTCADHFGHRDVFNYKGWKRLCIEYGSRLPVRIKALPEGTVTVPGIPLVTVESTDPQFPWITNFLESLLLQVWYPTTVASVSYNCRKTILKYLEETGTPSSIDFKLHDFGFRGCSSVETAKIGGMAHLVNFKGTDTMPAIIAAQQYYKENMAGHSIPATEHSTVTSWTQEHERMCYSNLIRNHTGKLVACVIDSYDMFNAIIHFSSLKETIKESGVSLVLRPDSGDPVESVLGALKLMAQEFGVQKNDKGYAVLPPYMRLIQGDGVNPKSIGQILEAMKEAGFSADNIAFGMGGRLLQAVTRDTCNFAFKCSSVTIRDQEVDVFKAPKTDPTKKSKAGKFKVTKTLPPDGGGPAMWQCLNAQAYPDVKDMLQVVYDNGQYHNLQTFSEIRERVHKG